MLYLFISFFLLIVLCLLFCKRLAKIRFFTRIFLFFCRFSFLFLLKKVKQEKDFEFEEFGVKCLEIIDHVQL
jgi:hypothetical protein